MMIVYHGNNMKVLENTYDESVDLIIIDPPYNTGKVQKKKTIKTNKNQSGTRKGFGGKNYYQKVINEIEFNDIFDDYISFLVSRIIESKRVLKQTGSLFLFIDCREAHYCKIMLDKIFGRKNFMNEIIWAFDWGGRSKRKWSVKHNSIFWYCVDNKKYTFNYNDIDRIKYLAPSLQTPERVALGKVPTDVWWQTIACGKERTTYPTQKPLKLLERIVKVHSNPGDLVLDFFAGSGTTGEAALKYGRDCILVDNNLEAINVMKERFKEYKNVKFMDLFGVEL